MTTLSTLNALLATKVRDTGYKVWASAEMDEALTEACQTLWPRAAKPITESVTIVADTDTYSLTTVAEVSRIDVLDSNGVLLYSLSPGSWELRGADYEQIGSVSLFVNRYLSMQGATLKCYGYAPYLITDTLPPRYTAYILARAGAELIRRMFSDRAKFTQWMAVAQEQNVSPIEFSVMQSEMNNEALRLQHEIRTWRKPKPATI